MQQSPTPSSLQTALPNKLLIPVLVSRRHLSSRTPPKAASGKSKKLAKQAATRVLLFSGMLEFALYRAEVLRAHGFDVRTPRTKEEAVQAIKRADLDVVVLAYTLPSETVHELADLVREHCPACRLVTISESREVDRKIAPDDTAVAGLGPAGL